MLTDTRPFSLLIKPAGSRCNLACRYCFYTGTDGLLGGSRPKVMSYEILDKMIEDYLSYGFPTSVFIWQGGEPTLCGLDFFRHTVEKQQQLGGRGQVVANALQTNGMVINDEWAEFLAQYRFLVGLSIDGPEEIHNTARVTGSGKPTFDKVMQAAETFRKYGVEFNILSMISRHNQNRGREVYRFLVDEGFDYLQFIPCVEYNPESGEPMSEYNVTPEGYGQFMSDVFDEWYESGDIGKISVRTFESLVGIKAGVKELSLCNTGNYCNHYIVVEKEGDVYPCDFFVKPEWYLGNLMDTPLYELFDSPKEHEFAAIKGKYDKKCRICPYLGLCHGGCPKDRLCKGGGAFAGRTEICEGLKMFYGHTEGRINELARDIRRQRGPSVPVVGRNDPCPCGSGKKYKKCCMNT